MNEFIELSLFGAKFIWSNKQDRLVISRIDGFLISKKCEDHFVGVFQAALVRELSYHRPIKLFTEEED